MSRQIPQELLRRRPKELYRDREDKLMINDLPHNKFKRALAEKRRRSACG